MSGGVEGGERGDLREICPRCGSPGTPLTRVIAGREYIYFIHWLKDEKKTKQCYIGPKEGYVYIEEVHSQVHGDGYGLTNVRETDLFNLLSQVIYLIQKTINSLDAEKLKKYISLIDEFTARLFTIKTEMRSRIKTLSSPSITAPFKPEAMKTEAIDAKNTSTEKNDREIIERICRTHDYFKISLHGFVKMAKIRGYDITPEDAERILMKYGEYVDKDDAYEVKCSNLEKNKSE